MSYTEIQSAGYKRIDLCPNCGPKFGKETTMPPILIHRQIVGCTLQVYCPVCSMQGPGFSAYGTPDAQRINEAIDAWNALPRGPKDDRILQAALKELRAERDYFHGEMQRMANEADRTIAHLRQEARAAQQRVINERNALQSQYAQHMSPTDAHEYREVCDEMVRHAVEGRKRDIADRDAVEKALRERLKKAEEELEHLAHLPLDSLNDFEAAMIQAQERARAILGI